MYNDQICEKESSTHISKLLFIECGRPFLPICSHIPSNILRFNFTTQHNRQQFLCIVYIRARAAVTLHNFAKKQIVILLDTILNRQTHMHSITAG